MSRVYVSVVGGSDRPDIDLDRAEEVGRLLAEAGAVLVTGGLTGVMEASSRGACEAGGVVVGILPGMDRGDANPFCTIVLPSGLGEARNWLVVRAADAVIAIGGEYGTLSEIAYAIKGGTPVVGLGTWEVHQPAMDSPDPITRVTTPAEAVGAALKAGTEGRDTVR